VQRGRRRGVEMSSFVAGLWRRKLSTLARQERLGAHLVTFTGRGRTDRLRVSCWDARGGDAPTVCRLLKRPLPRQTPPAAAALAARS